MRQYHVECWVKQKGESVPQDMHDLVKLCQKLTTDNKSLEGMKVVENQDLWQQCREARLRLNKKEADDIVRKEARKKKGRAKSPISNVRKKKTLSKKNGSIITTQNTDPVIAALRAAKKTAPKKTGHQTTTLTSSIAKSQLSISPVQEKRMSQVECSSNLSSQTSSSTILKSPDLSIPSEVCKATEREREETVGSCIDKSQQISLNTLNLSETNLNIPGDQTEVTDSIQPTNQAIGNTEESSLTRIGASGFQENKSLDGNVGNDVEPTALKTSVAENQKKLSLKEYQEKFRKQGKDSIPTEEDIKPFMKDDEIEVVGIKQGTNVTDRFGTLEPLVKKEKPSSSDLLDRNSGDVVIEATVKAPQIDPISAFKCNVTHLVKEHLLNYYAKDANDLRKKNGDLKEIKIKTENEFIQHCKFYSKKFQSDILDAYIAINGSTDGIEKESVKQYGIGFDIDKYFSQK